MRNFDDRFAERDEETDVFFRGHVRSVPDLKTVERERVQNEKDIRALRSERFSVFSVVARLVLILIIGFPVIQFLFTGDVTIFNIETIFSMLENAPVIDMSWLSNVTHNFDIPYIVGSWTILDGLRVFLNYIVDFLNLVLDSFIFIGWIGTGVLNGVIFITYFVSIAVGGV